MSGGLLDDGTRVSLPKKPTATEQPDTITTEPTTETPDGSRAWDSTTEESS